MRVRGLGFIQPFSTGKEGEAFEGPIDLVPAASLLRLPARSFVVLDIPQDIQSRAPSRKAGANGTSLAYLRQKGLES